MTKNDKVLTHMSGKFQVGIVDTDSKAVREKRIEAQKIIEREIHEGALRGIPFRE